VIYGRQASQYLRGAQLWLAHHPAELLVLRRYSAHCRACLFLALALFSVIIAIGRLRISLMFVDGQQPRLRNLVSDSHLLLRFIGASIIRGLIVLVGFLFFIIPGVIIAIGLSFYIFVMLAENAGAATSLQRSWELTRGVKWELVAFGIIIAILNFLGALALGIGLLFTAPTSLVAFAHLYRQLTQQTSDSHPADQGTSASLPAPPPTPAAAPQE